MENLILQKASSGDSKALTFLINKYKDIAFNLALNIVKNNVDAQDIVQESFLKVLENISKFRNESKFSTWLYRIVYNQSIQMIAKNKSTFLSDLKLDIYNISTEDIVLKEEKYIELYQMIEKLENNERTIIQLFYLAEKSIKEIENITQLSKSNIKVILHRARKKLQHKLTNDNEQIRL